MVDRLAEARDTASVRVVPDAEGRMRLSVERLDALEIPESLVELRALTAAMLPRIDLPELLLEVHAWTGFLHAYVHVSGHDTRMSDLPISVAALLIAEACNVGLVPVTDPDVEALTRGRALRGHAVGAGQGGRAPAAQLAARELSGQRHDRGRPADWARPGGLPPTAVRRALRVSSAHRARRRAPGPRGVPSPPTDRPVEPARSPAQPPPRTTTTTASSVERR